MDADLTNQIFTNEEAARAHFEVLRWPDGRVCPHCRTVGNSTLLQGKSTRPGLYKCKDCGKPFTATMGTVYERSHIPLHKWLLATHLLCASKKGISAHQLWRMLGFGSYRTAWFMAHRIREAMKDDAPASPLGGEGKIVEADETYFGPKDRITTRTKKGKPGLASKRMVFALVERGGRGRMFYVERGTAATIRDVLVRNASRKSELHTDESNFYPVTGEEFDSHHAVKHTAGEYVRYEEGRVVHTNTVENIFSVLKRGMKGVYQHCGEAHLHRYLAEFGFRYNERTALGVTDRMRAEKAVKGTVGRRLTYKKPDERPQA